MSITNRSGQAMVGLSITTDNMPPHIQLGIETSTKLFGLIIMNSIYCTINAHKW